MAREFPDLIASAMLDRQGSLDAGRLLDRVRVGIDLMIGLECSRGQDAASQAPYAQELVDVVRDVAKALTGMEIAFVVPSTACDTEGCIEPQGHEGPHLYRCGPACPGVTWKASRLRHPPPCGVAL